MKLKCYIHAKYNDWEKKYAFDVWSRDMSKVEGFGAAVGTGEIDFDPPPHEVLVKGTVAEYRERQTKILGEAEAMRAELEKRINELLCLEYKP